MPERGKSPVEWLRGVALSLERLAAQGVASGAVRGATDELRSGLPDDVDGAVRTLAEDGVTALSRLAAEAARARTSPLETWSTRAAAGAMRGAVEEARRLVPEMQSTTQELLARLKLWLDRSASESAARAQELHAPGERARTLAAGAVKGAADQLATSMPDLAAPATDLAAQLGRALVRGTAEELRRQLRLAGRDPRVRAVMAGGLFLAVLVAVRRRG
jgi:hypothetical protein